eukprot:2582329-Rhodomonas_salina.1
MIPCHWHSVLSLKTSSRFLAGKMFSSLVRVAREPHWQTVSPPALLVPGPGYTGKSNLKCTTASSATTT